MYSKGQQTNGYCILNVALKYSAKMPINKCPLISMSKLRLLTEKDLGISQVLFNNAANY